MKALARIQHDRWLGGVCGGIAYAVGCPVWVARLAMTAATLCTAVPVALYLLVWFFMPRWEQTPFDFAARTNRWYDEPHPASARAK